MRAILAILITLPFSVAALGQEALPAPHVADTHSPEEWPSNPKAPTGAPNILLIMTDDVGFGASSAFGGPIPTPAFDEIARRGLSYNQFNTAAMCSPTRAALLTGRNPHAVGMGMITNHATGFDGYNSVIPKSAGTIAEILRQHGYSTAAFGKWHITPEWEQSPVGPFDRWPIGMGFEHFYGFLGADTSMWAPSLIVDNSMIEPPKEDGVYHFERDLADKTINWVRTHEAAVPNTPFFLYLATAAAHSPHHAPPEWLERFRGKFDMGWDVLRQQIFDRQKRLGVIPSGTRLTPRPAFLPAWNTMTSEQRRIYARLMEAYAANLAFADHQIGRVIDELRASGELENTLIVYIQGDNGGSAEGGLNGLLFEQSYINGYPESVSSIAEHADSVGGGSLYNTYPAAWAWALNAPFRYYKQIGSHFGGVRNAMAISWPARIKNPGLRQQFHYVTDVFPTLLEAAGVAPPATLNGIAQQPLNGVSMSYSFDKPHVPSMRKTQVFEMRENLAIYRDGWMAATVPSRAPWDIKREAEDIDARTWELYHVAEDFSQSKDVSASNLGKLTELREQFWVEAARGKILPIHERTIGAKYRPTLNAGRTSFRYLPGVTRLPENAAPKTVGNSFTINAEVMLPDDKVNGVIVAQGGRYGGYVLYMQHGHLKFHYNGIGDRQYRVATLEPIAAGKHSLSLIFEMDPRPGKGGEAALSVDGIVMGIERVEKTIPILISHSEGLDIGKDTITSVSQDYSVDESAFTGNILEVVFDIRPPR